MTYDFRPAGDGGWLALAAGPRLLVVPAVDDAHAALAALDSPTGFQAALDLLTGKGLAATPPFVLLDWSDGVDATAIVRGNATLTVTDAEGEQPVTAVGVSTWVERTLPGVTRLAVTVPGAVATGAAVLPLDRGAALVAEVAVGAPSPAQSVAPAPSSKPEPVVSPDPVPPTPAAAAPEPDPEPVVEATVAAPEFGVTAMPVVAPEPPEDESSYDYLFGDTMYRSVSDAAVHAEPAEGEAAPEEQAGDHDGQTVLTSDIAKLKAGRKRTAAAKPDTAPPPAQLVLVLSTTGAREPLTQPVLVGRSPSVSKVSGGSIPRLLVVGNGDQDISRNHAQFAVEGGTVVVTDLHSKNGTSIVLPGKDAQKLRPGEPTSVIPGTVVDLGGGISFTVDED